MKLKFYFLFIQLDPILDMRSDDDGFLDEAKFTLTKMGKYKLIDNQYELVKHHTAKKTTYWMCTKRIKLKCKGKCYTKTIDGRQMIKRIAKHNH